MDGILNIFKEKGYTSHDVVAIVRRTINQKKVGHTGTLDPDAEGVLPICVGKATKLADYIMNSGIIPMIFQFHKLYYLILFQHFHFLLCSQLLLRGHRRQT